MFTSNHFAELSAFIPVSVMQWYIVIMILLVIGGTLFDVIHKRSSEYFFRASKQSKINAKREVAGGEKASLAVQTVMSEVLTSSEFCNTDRRIAHLLTMYGFVAYLVTTIIMVFGYPTTTTPTPAILPVIWYLGAFMVCVGGYWFWFFIRVDVAAEGNSPLRLIRADLFIISVLSSVTFGLIWAIIQASGVGLWSNIFLGLYLIATTVLFGSIPWSKFAHMFFKPAAAYQKRVSEADGSRDNLPEPADRPKQFGLGIKRLKPRNY